MYMHNNHCHRATAYWQLKIIIIIIIIVIVIIIIIVGAVTGRNTVTRASTQNMLIAECL
jgi:competence protein ComGC